MKKIYWTKAVIYSLLGIFILIFHENILQSLNYFVGVGMIVASIEEILIIWIGKKYKEYEGLFYTPVSILIFGIMILFIGKDSLEFVCILWAVVSIIGGTKELNKILHHRENNTRSWVLGMKDFASIVLAILLMIHPEAHVQFHLILLGIHFIVEGIGMSLRAFLNSDEILLSKIKEKTIQKIAKNEE